MPRQSDVSEPARERITTSLDADRPKRLGGRVKAGPVGQMKLKRWRSNVPYFRVLLEGEGIEVPSKDNGPSIAGFFATRLVRAGTADEAEEKAKSMILSEWTSGSYANANKGSLPNLTISSVHKSSFMERFMSKFEGYTFYPYDHEVQIDKSA